jgi:hypothetical protein
LGGNGINPADGTAIRTYNNLANLADLYFGLVDINIGQPGPGGTGIFSVPNPFVISGIGTNTITMITNFDVNTLAGTQSGTMYFTATLSAGLTWQPASNFGINSPYAFVDLTGLPGFSVTESFTVGGGPGVGTPFNLWYNGLPGNNNLGLQNFSEVSGDFQATTPLPAALPLFATGLGGLSLLGWRRKRKAQAIA